MDGWIDGDWVDGDWIAGAPPALVPGYWSHLYWAPGYWDPHYWGLEPIRASYQWLYQWPLPEELVPSEEEDFILLMK